MRKLTAREVIARSFPTWSLSMTWDLAKADRLIASLDENGYQIVEKTSRETNSIKRSTLDREPP
jgi:hypothetical protein